MLKAYINPDNVNEQDGRFGELDLVSDTRNSMYLTWAIFISHDNFMVRALVS